LHLPKICSTFAGALQIVAQPNLKTTIMEELTTKQKLRKFFINKYAISLYLFAIIYIFIGEQSLIKRISKAREINEIKEEIELVNQQTQEIKNMLNSLDIKDSLENYAREEYHMHADGEVVYLVD
jgi:cell division protein FtsB